LIHRAHSTVGQNTGEQYNYYEKQKQFEKEKKRTNWKIYSIIFQATKDSKQRRNTA
jgi:hypothetical protein